MSLTEASDTYIPPNYIITDARENIIATIKAILEKIREEASKDEEYQRQVWEIWEYLDKQPIEAIEASIVELEGLILAMKDAGEGIANPKRLKTELTDYLNARLDTGEVEPNV